MSRNEMTAKEYKEMLKSGELRIEGGRLKGHSSSFQDKKININDYDYIIGIDPGEHNGICSVDLHQKIIYLYCVNFWKIIENLYNQIDNRTLIIIEDTTQISPVYDRYKPNNLKAFGKIAQNIGENKCVARLLISFCKNNNIECVCVKPSRQSKINSEYFNKLFNCNIRTNEHVRDSAMLIYRLNIIDFKKFALLNI